LTNSLARAKEIARNLSI